MRIASLLVFALAAGGCGSGAAPAAAPAQPATGAQTNDVAAPAGPERFVLLNAAASLYRAPGDAEPLLDRSAWSAARAAPHYTNALRLVGERGEWLEVETLGHELFSEHCAGTVSGFESLRIRMFARRADVFPVLTQPVENEYADGTSVRLLPGVALGDPELPDKPTVRWVHDGAFEVAAVVGDDKVGWFYTGNEAFELPDTDGLPWLSTAAFRDGAIHYAGGATLGPVPGEDDIRAVDWIYAAEDRGDDKLVELRSQCVTLQVLVPAAHVSEPGDTGGILGSLSVGTYVAEPPLARAGATAYWRGGAKAGTVVRDRGFVDEVATDGERRCFREVTASRWVKDDTEYGHSEPIEHVELCFDSADVADE